MKRFFIITVITLLSVLTTSLCADDLNDFKEDVEKEEETNNNEEAQSDGDENEEENSETSSFMKFLWEFTFLMWFIHNETVYYTPYPYEMSGISTGDSFIGHDKRSQEELLADKYKTKDYNFVFYGGATFNEDFNTYGGLLRFTGKFFNHLGPEIDYRILYDGSDVLHNLSAGINLSFFQFDYLSLDFYIKGAFFMGLLERQGISFGGRFTSYPFKPLSIEIRSGGIFYSSITFAEIEAKIGIHFGRVEIFGDFYTLQSQNSQLYTIGFGAGVHF